MLIVWHHKKMQTERSIITNPWRLRPIHELPIFLNTLCTLQTHYYIKFFFKSISNQ